MTIIPTIQENSKAILRTDSLSHLQSLQDMYIKHPIVTHIFETIYYPGSGITIHWLTGQLDIPQSTNVNRLVKLATE